MAADKLDGVLGGLGPRYDGCADGPDGVRFYSRMKTVTARWPSSPRTESAYVMPTMK